MRTAAAAGYFTPDTQQALSFGGGTWSFSQQRGIGPCQPLRTNVQATQRWLAKHAPWHCAGDPFGGREKFVISEPGRSTPYSTGCAKAGALASAITSADATRTVFMSPPKFVATPDSITR
jgi:hypothetical protein